jgi:hypothetical protein
MQFAHETIFNRQVVMRKGLLVVEMTKAFAKVFIFIVPDLEQAIFDTKSLAVVVVEFVVVQLHDPIVYVFAVKELYPFTVRSAACMHNANRDHEGRKCPENAGFGFYAFHHYLPPGFPDMNNFP